MTNKEDIFVFISAHFAHLSSYPFNFDSLHLHVPFFSREHATLELHVSIGLLVNPLVSSRFRISRSFGILASVHSSATEGECIRPCPVEFASFGPSINWWDIRHNHAPQIAILAYCYFISSSAVLSCSRRNYDNT